MKILSIVLLLVIAFTGCGTAYKAVNLSDLKIGMTKQQAMSVLNKKPDNVIGAKQYADGVVEVLQYSRYNNLLAEPYEKYWLYFYNDILKQWGRPGDWQKEADKVYEIRVK